MRFPPLQADVSLGGATVFSRTFVLKIVVSFVIAAFGMNVIVMDLAFLGLDPDRDHMVIGRSRCNSPDLRPTRGDPQP